MIFICSRIRLSATGIFVALTLICGCSGATDAPGPAPFINRPYDYARKGVQITKVYYDEEANKKVEGMHNEWIVVQSDTDIGTDGWWIGTKNNVRSYAFPMKLKKSLVIYTRPQGSSTDLQRSMGLNSFILDGDSDTITIYNENSQIVSVLRY